MRVVPWPLVSRALVVKAFRPGTRSPSPEAPFRTLRRADWVTSGVTFVPRAEGQAKGRVTFFSSLNLEAARQARLGHAVAARALARDAEAIEQTNAFEELVDLLRRAPPTVARGVLEGRLPENAPARVSSLLEDLAERTERVRKKRAREWELLEVSSGTVVELRASHVRLHLDPEGETLLPRVLSDDWEAHQGSALSIAFESLGEGSAQVLTRPGLELKPRAAAKKRGGPTQDSTTPAHLRRVFEPGPVLRISGAEMEKLSGRPAPLKVLVPVEIEG